MCVTCLFEDHDPSLLSTKHVALSTSYNTKIAQHKHTIQSKHNQSRQEIEKCWFNISDFLKLCDKRDVAKDYGWQDINLRAWLERSND
jgi:hypothetical protein